MINAEGINPAILPTKNLRAVKIKKSLKVAPDSRLFTRHPGRQYRGISAGWCNAVDSIKDAQYCGFIFFGNGSVGKREA
jgi:hypothetical protein